MIYISHRGNIFGPNKKDENNPNYIKAAIQKGFHVEVDVWYKKNALYLGHDNPKYKISNNFLRNSKIWCHAKNIESFFYLLKKKYHCVWHQDDDFALTSKGFIWTYPGKKITSKSIIVLPERCKNISIKNKKSYGICSDFIWSYKFSKK